MDELVKTFHIDWKLLIAQAINFTIVLAVLYFFALKPIMKIMNDRTKKIETGIKNAEQSENNLKEAEVEKQAQITAGRKEAQLIVTTAQKDSQVIKDKKLEETKEQAQKVITQAKNEIDNQKQLMLKEVKAELADLILLATNKLTKQTLDKKSHEKIISEILQEIKTTKIS